MDTQKHYGFLQLRYGADHIFIYSEEQIREEFRRYNISEDILPKSKDENGCISFFPMGGSNSSDSTITLLETEEDIREYLCQEALGPDLDDPTLISLVEYYFSIDTDYGCNEKWLKHFGFEKKELEEKAIQGVKDTCNYVCDKLNIEIGQFYNDEYREIRLSEVG